MSDDENDNVEEEVEDKEDDKKKPTGFPIPKDKPRFEVKKWQAVTLWSWGMRFTFLIFCCDHYELFCCFHSF